MNLVNQTVVHKTFGEGTVIAHNGDYIIVKFAKEEKKFIYPDIFTTFVKCKDANLQAELEVAFAAKEEAKAQKVREERERALREAEEAKKRAEEVAKASVKRATAQPRKSNENNLRLSVISATAVAVIIALDIKAYAPTIRSAIISRFAVIAGALTSNPPAVSILMERSLALSWTP